LCGCRQPDAFDFRGLILRPAELALPELVESFPLSRIFLLIQTNSDVTD